MNPVEFLDGINDIDEQLIQSSLDFLQEDNMDKKIIRKGGLTLSKIILVAAIAAGIVGVTAFASELFPSIFSKAEQELTEEYTTGWAQNRAELYEKAAKASEGFEPEYIDLPELNDSRIIIGEKYYDGENYLIGYRLEENKVPARFDFGPNSPEFKNMRLNYSRPGRNLTFDECLERGMWSQFEYDRHKLFLESFDLKCVQRASSYWSLVEDVAPNITDEEWDRVCEELREKGHVGVVCRKNSLEYDVYLEDGTILPNPSRYNSPYGGTGKGINQTEYGNVFVYYDLPEEYRDLETLTLYFKFAARDEYHYIDAEKGAKIRSVPAGEVLVPVTLTLTKQ